MADECNCGGTIVPDTHSVSCPASLYQAGIQRGHAEDRERTDAAWNLGYAQAVDEVLSEVRAHSPTLASAIMNRFPTWKAIVHEVRDRAGRQGRLPL